MKQRVVNIHRGLTVLAQKPFSRCDACRCFFNILKHTSKHKARWPHLSFRYLNRIPSFFSLQKTSYETLVTSKLIPTTRTNRPEVCFNSGIGTLSLSITKPWLLTMAAVLKLGGSEWVGHGGDMDGWVDSRVDHQSLVDALSVLSSQVAMIGSKHSRKGLKQKPFKSERSGITSVLSDNLITLTCQWDATHHVKEKSCRFRFQIVEERNITTSPVSAAPSFPKSLASSSLASKLQSRKRCLSGLGTERWVASFAAPGQMCQCSSPALVSRRATGLS